MSRTLIALIALMLGFPVAAFVAAGAAGGLNPSIYSDAIGVVTGVCFVGAAFIEIHRLAKTRSEDLLDGWMAQQTTEIAASVERASRYEFDRARVEVLRAHHG